MPVSIFTWQPSTVCVAAASASARPAQGVETVGVSRCVEDAVEVPDAEGAEDQDRR